MLVLISSLKRAGMLVFISWHVFVSLGAYIRRPAGYMLKGLKAQKERRRFRSIWAPDTGRQDALRQEEIQN